MTKEIKGIKVTVTNGELEDQELEEYVKYVDEKYAVDGYEVNEIDLTIVDNEYIDLEVHRSEPFERIRRITGYLVGTLNKFNNAKRAEVSARVKHGTSGIESKNGL